MNDGNFAYFEKLGVQHSGPNNLDELDELDEMWTCPRCGETMLAWQRDNHNADPNKHDPRRI